MKDKVITFIGGVASGYIVVYGVIGLIGGLDVFDAITDILIGLFMFLYIVFLAE